MKHRFDGISVLAELARLGEELLFVNGLIAFGEFWPDNMPLIWKHGFPRKWSFAIFVLIRCMAPSISALIQVLNPYRANRKQTAALLRNTWLYWQCSIKNIDQIIKCYF